MRYRRLRRVKYFNRSSTEGFGAIFLGKKKISVGIGDQHFDVREMTVVIGNSEFHEDIVVKDLISLYFGC